MEKLEEGEDGKDLQPVLLSLPGRTPAEANSEMREDEANEASRPVPLPPAPAHASGDGGAVLDDLVEVDHPVKMVEAVVERLDVAEFCQPIKARERGSDAFTRPRT